MVYQGRAKSVFNVNYHHFLQLEKSFNYLEIAEELGISIGEVKALKEKIIRT